MVGLVWGLLSNNWHQYAQTGLYAFPEGILGGALFAVANLLIPTVVNRLGLGVGFMLWNATNITFGFLISRFGLFGVPKTIPTHPLLSLLGILLMLGSIGVYGMIKPTLSDDKDGDRLPSTNNLAASPTERSSLLTDHSSLLTAPSPPRTVSLPVIAMRKSSIQDVLMPEELPNFGPFMMPADVSEHVALADEKAEAGRKLTGALVALVVGAFLSGALVPYANWQRACRPENSDQVVATCNPLDFVFSQCLGVYITSTIAFLAYSLFHRFILRRSMPRSVMRPSYFCGVLWALGLGGQLYSFGKLGFDQAFPLSSIGPAMVSMLWSACYFKEMRGARNQRVLAIGTAMVLLGTLARVVSM